MTVYSLVSQTHVLLCNVMLLMSVGIDRLFNIFEVNA